MAVGDAVAIGLSGVRAAYERQRSSAHNVANLASEDFHNLRTRQEAQPGGGVRAISAVEPDRRPVDLPAELVEQKLASVQAKASARVASTALELRGSLIDIFA